MLVGDKYRHYSGLGGTKKTKLEARNNISLEEAASLLKSLFGIVMTEDELLKIGYFSGMDRKALEGTVV